MSEDHARREVRRAVEALGGRTRFAEAAKIDPGTLGDFLDGRRWAQPRTRTKIEVALGWPAGRIMDLADGVVSPAADDAEPPYFDVVHAIRNDPDLLPEAKEHLERQYGLLRRLNPQESRESVQERVTEEKVTELRARRQPKKQAKDKTDKPAPRKGPAKRPR